MRYIWPQFYTLPITWWEVCAISHTISHRIHRTLARHGFIRERSRGLHYPLEYGPRPHHVMRSGKIVAGYIPDAVPPRPITYTKMGKSASFLVKSSREHIVIPHIIEEVPGVGLLARSEFLVAS